MHITLGSVPDVLTTVVNSNVYYCIKRDVPESEHNPSTLIVRLRSKLDHMPR